MDYLHIKAIHIIFVVSWFAGLFYLPRLFIYHTEATQRIEIEKDILSKQFEKMERLLMNAIMFPAMILTVITGLSMIYLNDSFLQESWLQLKLVFVLGLIGYHFFCQKLMFEMRKGYFRFTSFQLRLWNEVATIFLFAIVFVVVLKNAIAWIWGVLGLIIFAVVIMLAVRMAKKMRDK
jgi:protoporphyrinogen IX oxidase